MLALLAFIIIALRPNTAVDLQQVRELAAAWAARPPRYRAFVLIQGLCGLRPGEALDLRRRDIDLEPPPAVGDRAREPFIRGEPVLHRRGDPPASPQGRGSRASRTIPLPDELVALLRCHLNEFVDDRQDALVFTNTAGRRISLSNFGRDVWSRARAALFSDDDPLRNVRRHDLRHAAITASLNAGVPLKTAQAWSGHKTASVLLNTYLGVLRSDEGLALERWADALKASDVDHPVTVS